MTVCKFFLQGNCRYGSRCNYEHPSGGSAGYAYSAQRQLFGGGTTGGGRNAWGGGGGGTGGFGGQNRNKYKWTAGDSQKGNQQQSAQDLINGLMSDMSDWEVNKMWPFSCVGIDKGLPCVPDFPDTSSDELRYAAYEAKKTGSIQSYIEQVQKLASDFNTKKQMLKNPSMAVKQKLNSLIEDFKIKKQRSEQNSSQGNTTGTALFSSTGGFGNANTQGTSTNPFGGGTSRFGQSPLASSTSPFGTSSSMNANPFGSATTATPTATGGFGTGQTATGVFGTTTPAAGGFGASTGGFGSSTAPGGTFSTSTPATKGFGASTPNTSVFGGASSGTPSVFGQNSVLSNNRFGALASGNDIGQSASSGNTTTLFGKPQNSSTGTNPFCQSQTVPSTNNTFAAAGSSTGFGNSFGKPSPASNLFNVSSHNSTAGLFSSNSQNTTSTFGTSTSSGGPSVPGGTQTSSVYTPLDKLTPEELEAFKAPSFTLGKIPTKPPPVELIN